MLVCPLDAKSVGELTLNKTHPLSQPLFDPHYLEDPYDMQAFKKAIRVAKKIGKSTPLNRKGTKLALELANSPFEYAYDSEDFWEWCIEHMAFSSYHTVKTVGWKVIPKLA